MSAKDLLAPVSLPQERLWFLDRLVPGSPAYNVPTVIPIPGETDIGRIHIALQRLINRHGALRTSFAEVDGVPMQRVSAHIAIELPLSNLANLEEHEQCGKLHELCKQEASAPFSLDTGPLVRARLVRITGQYLLLLTLHHICADAWSLGILLQDFASFLATGQGTDRPASSLSYVDFARIQRERLRGPLLDKLMAYWRERLHEAPEVLSLPFDRPRPPAQTFAGALRSFEIPADVAAGLRHLAARARATPFMALLAAFNILLARYSGSTDIVVGTPIANRDRAELENLVGFVANTLALRVRLSFDSTFMEIMERVRETTLSAYEHQELPFEKLVAELRPVRARDHGPVFQVLFALQNTPTLASMVASVDGAGLIDTDSLFSTAKFDLSLLMGETETGFVGSFEYNTDLFDCATIEGMLASFQTLLKSIVEAPARAISQLPLLDASRRRQMLLSGSPAACCELTCVQAMLAPRIRHWPSSNALRSGSVVLSYADLEVRSDALARALRALGVVRGERVGVLMSATPLALVSVLAVLKTGAAFVPLDPQLPTARLRYMVSDALLTCILREPGLGAFLDDLGVCLVDCTDALWREHNSGEPFVGEPTTTPEDLAYVIYTSGSTGSPKGIAMAHGPFCNMIANTLRDSRLTAPTTLQFAPWGFDVMLQELFSTWSSGGTLVIPEPTARRDPVVLLRVLQLEAVARIFLTPAALYQLAEVAVTRGIITPELKEIVSAGEALLATPSLRKWLSALPDCRLINHYGPAESHVVTEYWLEPSPAEWPSRAPIGKPIQGTTVLLLDDSMNMVPVGVPGEICIGRQIARGYLSRPDLNAQQFISAPFAPGVRFYRSGDQGRLRRDGLIEFLGRLDRQVKIRGYRVEPAEIDAVLALHPSVRMAATLHYCDEFNTTRLISYIVPKGATFDAADIRQFLATRLAEYMIPCVFVSLKQFPLTENGKLNIAALPPPEMSRDALDVPYVEPRGPAEEVLVGIWKNLLGVALIGIRDDFFTLGGHSLLAVRLLSRVRDHFGVDLSVADVFEAPTISGFAERILAQQLARESDSDLESLITSIEAMSEKEARLALAADLNQ